MAATSNIFHVYLTTNNQPIVLRCERPSFSNTQQPSEEDAKRAADQQHQRLRTEAEQHYGPLSYTGTFEGEPLGDELYTISQQPIPIPSLFIGAVPQGHPWIYLAAAPTKQDVLTSLQEDVEDGYQSEQSASTIKQSLQSHTNGILFQ